MKAKIEQTLEENNGLIKSVLSKVSIQIGITDEEKAAIGAVHEFGLGNNPRRSFLREPIEKNRKQILNEVAILAQGSDVPPQSQGIPKEIGEWVKDNVVLPAFSNNHSWKSKVDGSQATLGDLKDHIEVIK